MRELEFLPPWYMQLRHRRRLVLVQLWATIVLGCGLAMWMSLVQRNERATNVALEQLCSQLTQTDEQLKQMDRLSTLQRQWRQKAEVLERLGAHVESSRLLSTIAEALPERVSLMSFQVDVEESAGSGTRADGKSGMDRRLRVRLQGVAPTDVELASFLTELNRIPFLENVAPTYARDRREPGHVLREFELMFTVNLNMPVGS